MRIRERLVQFTSVSDLEAHGFELEDGEAGPDKAAEMSELKNCVSGAIELLPEIYRDVYLRREILGERAEDVSLTLGISLPAVKSRLFRAREMMRDALDGGLGCRSLADMTP
jgi:RNA polymerase sigma-70 factor (ECF subfamily)